MQLLHEYVAVRSPSGKHRKFGIGSLTVMEQSSMGLLLIFFGDHLELPDTCHCQAMITYLSNAFPLKG